MGLCIGHSFQDVVNLDQPWKKCERVVLLRVDSQRRSPPDRIAFSQRGIRAHARLPVSLGTADWAGSWPFGHGLHFQHLARGPPETLRKLDDVSLEYHLV